MICYETFSAGFLFILLIESVVDGIFGGEGHSHFPSGQSEEVSQSFSQDIQWDHCHLANSEACNISLKEKLLALTPRLG